MRKRKTNGGFTILELLVVVAIVGILTGVSFVAVVNHQRSVARMEQDAIAKEIYVAAQNHLTMLRNEGYLGIEDGEGNPLGTPGTHADDANKDVYFVLGPKAFQDDPFNNILNYMLPVASIDETVRTGGNYIIRYQKSSGLVLDVWYCETKAKDNRFGKNLQATDYSHLMDIRPETIDENGNITKDPNRGSRLKDVDGAVIGWYGGAQAVDLAKLDVEAPSIVIDNGAKLSVTVTDPNMVRTDAQAASAKTTTLQLVIIGETSGTKAVVTLRAKGTVQSDDRIQGDDATGIYTFMLDDITTDGLHFAELEAKGGIIDIVGDGFQPGENITVQAQVFSESALSNIAYSDEEKTNSLFESLDGGTAGINNIRHLENLEKTVSGLNGNGKVAAVTVSKAEQTTDMDWDVFKEATKKADGNVQIYGIDGNAATTVNCYKPVSPDAALVYDGQRHNINNIPVNEGEGKNAGLFGALKTGSQVSNLALIDFDIKSNGANAGALVGTLTQDADLSTDPTTGITCNVSNVVAYHSKGKEALKITAGGTASHAGGLIGAVVGTKALIEKSAAAMKVESAAGNAGGLIGTAAGGTVNACYSGGHTIDRKDAGGNVIGVIYDPADTAEYNVTAGAVAGGLIGAAGETTIKNSYSTCSAKGETAGGFVGTAGGTEASTIENCYATGLVKGTGIEIIGGDDVTKDGAFAYSLGDGGSVTVTGCQYYGIINERKQGETYTYLTPLGKKGTDSGITALDGPDTTNNKSAAEVYDAFVGAETGWANAEAYDQTLYEYYKVGDGEVSSYNLKSLERLAGTNVTFVKKDATHPVADFALTHFGDWPAPEVFVFNTAANP